MLDSPGFWVGGPEGRAIGKDSILPCVAAAITYEAFGRRLVDVVNLELHTGSVTVVMGPNGAGKSLLLRLLHGLIVPTAGVVTWAGKTLNDQMRKRQAMVFQRPILLRRTVASNIDFVLSLRDGRDQMKCRRILKHFGLLHRSDHPARLLSGGEQQRLALARAMATEPDVLFLDEPTASLDPAATLAIEELVLEAHSRGTKIVFVTHDTGQARRLADEVVFLHHGHVTEHTCAEQFFVSPASAEARDFMAGCIVL